MYTLKVESLLGSILTLTQNEGDFQVVNADGLNPPKAIINSSVVAGMDGTRFNSSRLQERNIVITLRLNGNVERNRLHLYTYFRTKQWCKIYYKNSSRDVYIEGYVEAIDCDLFSQSELMQISIVCQDPYFKGLESIVSDISKTMHGFEFPFAFGSRNAAYGGDQSTDEAKEFSIYEENSVTRIDNISETDVGLLIEIKFTGTTVDPKIRNAITGEYFKVFGSYSSGDIIKINTNKGRKGVRLYRNGREESIFARLELDSTWLQLKMGVNYFTCEASRGDAYMRVTFGHNEQFEGV